MNHAFRSNEVIYIPDTQTSRRWRLGREWAEVRSRALLPIQLGSEVIGILDLQSSQPVRQPNLEIVGLKLLASQLGIVMRNSRPVPGSAAGARDRRAGQPIEEPFDGQCGP